MANTFVSNLIPRILPATLPVFREQVPLLTLCSKDYDGAAAQLGDTVTIQKPVALSVGNVNPAMIAPTPGDVAPGYVTISIANWKKANFGLTQKEYTEIIAGNYVPYQVLEAVRAVANQVAQDVLANYYAISNVAGKPGTGAFASDNAQYLSDMQTALQKALCPPGNRHAFLSLKDGNALRANAKYVQYYYMGDGSPDSILRTGGVGDTFKPFLGFKPHEDFYIPVHTAGTLGGSTCTLGANAAQGATSVTFASSGGTIALKAGDIVTIGSAPTDNGRYTYALMADLTITTGNSGTATLNRGLSTAQSSGASVALVNENSQAWASAVQNICGDPLGFGIVMRYPSEDLQGARVMYESQPMIDPVSGAVLCLTHLGGYHMSQWEVSALYGTAVVDERRLGRLLSYTSY